MQETIPMQQPLRQTPEQPACSQRFRVRPAIRQLNQYVRQANVAISDMLPIATSSAIQENPTEAPSVETSLVLNIRVEGEAQSLALFQELLKTGNLQAL